MSAWLYAASGIAVATTALHVWLGGRDAVGPLLGSRDLDEDARLTHLLCWHIVTVVLVALALAFLAGAVWEGQRNLALFAAMLAASFVVLNVGIVMRFRLRLLTHAQWAAFTPMALCGFLGAWP